MYFDIFPQTAFYSLQKNFCGRNFKILFHFDTSHKLTKLFLTCLFQT